MADQRDGSYFDEHKQPARTGANERAPGMSLATTPRLLSPGLMSSPPLPPSPVRSGSTGRFANGGLGSVLTGARRGSRSSGGGALGSNAVTPATAEAPSLPTVTSSSTIRPAKPSKLASLPALFRKRRASQTSPPPASPTLPPLPAPDEGDRRSGRSGSLGRLAGWASKSSVFLRSGVESGGSDALPLAPTASGVPPLPDAASTPTPTSESTHSTSAGEDPSTAPSNSRRLSGYGFFRRGSAASSRSSRDHGSTAPSIEESRPPIESPDTIEGPSLSLSPRLLTGLQSSSPSSARAKSPRRSPLVRLALGYRSRELRCPQLRHRCQRTSPWPTSTLGCGCQCRPLACLVRRCSLSSLRRRRRRDA